MNEDLKWLAENKHEWPEHQAWCWVVYNGDGNREISFVNFNDPCCEKAIYQNQWQAARDELSGKPSGKTKAALNDAETMKNEIDYHIKKGIRRKPGCEDYEICGYDSDGVSHTLTVSFNESNQIIDAELESVSSASYDEWRGPEDGLPPVGTECICEYYDYCRKTIKATIVAYNNGRVWVDSDCGDSLILVIRETDFKPVPSEEDKAVEEMASEYNKLTDQLTNGWTEYDIANHFVRVLGYRKQEAEQ